MGARKASGRVRDAEVAILRIGAQSVGLEILLAVMADGDLLLRPRALHAGLRPPLARDRLARGGFGTRLARDFCAAVLAAAREVGFFLAISALPFGFRFERLARSQ